MPVALEHEVDFLPSPVRLVEPIAAQAWVAFYFHYNLVLASVVVVVGVVATAVQASVDVVVPIAVLASVVVYYDENFAQA